MEADTTNVNSMSSMVTRFFPAVGPILLISMGYIDLGKWSAVIEGGARFGNDLVLPLFVFNCFAILCQYLSARIGVVTGMNLAQIYGKEYNKHICTFLGVQAELSIIVLDLTMILGTAHGLNLLFGVNLLTCLLFTATDAVLYPVLCNLLVKCKAEVALVSTAGFVLACYVFGALINLPEAPQVMSGTLASLSGESAFTLMSLLGASIMPHNFYVHSSIVLEQQEPANVSKSALCYDHFFAIFCVYSGIYLVNYVLMNSAATIFNSAGLVVLTFQDIVLLMDQVMRSTTALFALLLIVFVSSQISALTWNIGGQVVLNDLFRMQPPVWLHRALVRITVILLALYSTWNSGGEDIYQLLVFTQVLQAMLLPSSVIPLFRVASSRSIMGTLKISQFLEYLALITLIGMLGLNIIFVVEMVFGHSDWISNLTWNVGSLTSVPYAFLIVTACASLALMIWLASTPLKSATTHQADTQTWEWGSHEILDSQRPSLESYFVGEDYDSSLIYHDDKLTEEEPAAERSVDSNLDGSSVEFDFNLSETILDSDQEHIVVEENFTTDRKSPTVHHEEAATVVESSPMAIVDKEVANDRLLDSDTSKRNESVGLVEKLVEVDEDPQIEKDDDEGDIWEPEEPSREISEPTSTSEGPGSFRSLSGKADEGGSGNGSLSRLSGLGRAARRQLAAILDEFWGQLYDFHGQATKDAKAKKLDLLVGLDPKHVDSLKANHTGTGSSGYFASVEERGSVLPTNSSMYDFAKQQRITGNAESSYGFRTELPQRPAHMQYLDGYMQSSSRDMLDSDERRYSSLRLPPSRDMQSSSGDMLDSDERRYSSLRLPLSRDIQNSSRDMLDSNERRYSSLRLPPSRDMQSYSRDVLDSGEKRYSSLHLPPSSEGWNFQPANVQGYQLASYFGGVTDRNVDPLNTLLDSPSHKSPSTPFVSASYRDPLTYALARNAKSNTSTVNASTMHSPVRTRTSRLQTERSFNDPSFYGSGETVTSPVCTKKYHSLPDISGIAAPLKDSYLADRSSKWNGPPGFGPSAGRTPYSQSPQPNAGSGIKVPLAFEELSPSKPYGNAFLMQPGSSQETKSLWSRQPFEQLFGGAGETYRVSDGVGGKLSSVLPDSTYSLDPETELLQSFKYCLMRIMKLEGCEWLFRLNGGADEDLIDRVAASEKFRYEVETKDFNRIGQVGDAQYTDRRYGSASKNQDSSLAKFMVSSVSNCGDGCIWQVDLIVSFGVWCIHRILELSLMESRPELWGKYTYVLNRLQGILDPAFSKPRSPLHPCFCVQIPAANAKRSSPPVPNGSLPPAAKLGRGKCTSASNVLELIKDVEIAVSCRKGRTGTAAGDVAFPKGKENLASVLKRYKRRLSNKPGGTHDGLSSSHKAPGSTLYDS